MFLQAASTVLGSDNRRTEVSKSSDDSIQCSFDNESSDSTEELTRGNG